jgi:hypothetical protein
MAIVQTDGPFEKQLFQPTVFDDGHACFARASVDKDFFHGLGVGY